MNASSFNYKLKSFDGGAHAFILPKTLISRKFYRWCPANIFVWLILGTAFGSEPMDTKVLLLRGHSNFYLTSFFHRKNYPKIKLIFYLFQYKNKIITKQPVWCEYSKFFLRIITGVNTIV